MNYTETPAAAGRKVVEIRVDAPAGSYTIRGRIRKAAHNCLYIRRVDENGKTVQGREGDVQVYAPNVASVTISGTTYEVN